MESERAQEKWGIWDLAILVLGLNLWATFDLIPALHQPKALAASIWLLTAVPLVLLAGGSLLRNRALLLGAYPVSLLAPIVAAPRLVGVNVYSRWSFLLVSASFLVYTLGAALLLQSLATPAPAADRKQLHPAQPSGTVRQRRRIYLAMAVLTAAFPVALIATLYLDPAVQEAFRKHYPERATAAAVLFGALAMGLWLLLFHRYFYRTLRTHIRGDRDARADLVILRHDLRRPGPRPQFYLWVALALGMMVALYLAR